MELKGNREAKEWVRVEQGYREVIEGLLGEQRNSERSEQLRSSQVLRSSNLSRSEQLRSSQEPMRSIEREPLLRSDKLHSPPRNRNQDLASSPDFLSSPEKHAQRKVQPSTDSTPLLPPFPSTPFDYLAASRTLDLELNELTIRKQVLTSELNRIPGNQVVLNDLLFNILLSFLLFQVNPVNDVASLKIN